MKKIAKLTALVLAALMVMMCFTGCAAEQSAQGGEAAAAGGPFNGSADQTYYLITFYPQLSLWEPLIAGYRAAAEHLGVTVEIAGPNSLAPADNVAVLEQAVSMGATGICVSPVEPVSFIDSINSAMDQGVPVICVDADSPESNRLAYIGTSNYAAGQAGAEQLAKEIGGSGDVILFTMVGQLNHQERLRGAEEYLAANYPDIKVVDVLAAGKTAAEASAAFTASMQVNPNVKGVFSTVATGTLGVSQSIKDFGYEGLANVGFDTDPTILDAMAEGTATSTIAQNYFVMGYTALMEMYIHVNGVCNPYDGWRENGIPNIASEIDTGITVVTPENLHLFLPKEAG